MRLKNKKKIKRDPRKFKIKLCRETPGQFLRKTVCVEFSLYTWNTAEMNVIRFRGINSASPQCNGLKL